MSNVEFAPSGLSPVLFELSAQIGKSSPPSKSDDV